MMQPKQVLGILGGTFDPIHHGHLRLAVEACETLKFNKVHLIPSFEPVHRDLPIASPHERLDMTKIAVKGTSFLHADSREIERKKPSYMIDTLEDFRAEKPNASLALILGLDAFLGLPTWKRFSDFLSLAHIVIAHRPTFHLPDSGLLGEVLKQFLRHEISYIHHHVAGGIILLPITALDISASEIRKQIALGKNPRYLLPDSVNDYIQLHGIYKK